MALVNTRVVRRNNANSVMYGRSFHEIQCVGGPAGFATALQGLLAE